MRALLWLILLVSTALRLGVLLSGPDLDTDAYGHAMAGRFFIENPTDLRIHWVWLPLWHAIHGVFAAFGGGMTEARLLNVLLGALAPLLLARLLRRTTRHETLATAAGALLALWPLGMSLGQSAQPESLFQVLLLGAFVSWEEERFFWTGALLGIAVLCRYEAWVLPPVFLALWWRRRDPRGAMAWFLPGVSISAWCLAHAHATGEWLKFLRENREFAREASRTLGFPWGPEPQPLLMALWYPLIRPARELALFAPLPLLGAWLAWKTSPPSPLSLAGEGEQRGEERRDLTPPAPSPWRAEGEVQRGETSPPGPLSLAGEGEQEQEREQERERERNQTGGDGGDASPPLPGERGTGESEARALPQGLPPSMLWGSLAILGFLSYGWVQRLNLGLPRHFYALIPLYATLTALGLLGLLRHPRLLRHSSWLFPVTLGLFLVSRTLPAASWSFHTHHDAFPSARASASVLRAAGLSERDRVVCDFSSVELIGRLPRARMVRRSASSLRPSDVDALAPQGRLFVVARPEDVAALRPSARVLREDSEEVVLEVLRPVRARARWRPEPSEIPPAKRHG